jgi:hypothetical protein
VTLRLSALLHVNENKPTAARTGGFAPKARFFGAMSDPTRPSEAPAQLSPQQLQALRQVPGGALALSATAVLLLLVAWLLIYLLLYLPRGMVG